MRKAWAVMLVACVVTACSGDDGSTTTSGVGASPTASPYALLSDETWTLQEAVDPPAPSPMDPVERPPLEWYAEYVPSTADGSAMVRLSSHEGSYDDARLLLEERGFSLADVPLERWVGAGGSAPADPASPTVILLDNGASTLMVLSYELDLDQLAVVAEQVGPADQATWTAAGGVIQ